MNDLKMQANQSLNSTKYSQAQLYLLCNKITGLKGGLLTPFYQNALKTVQSTIATPLMSDEFEIVEKIKRKLAREGHEKDAAVFSELHRKLRSRRLLEDRWSIMYLLYKLRGGQNQPKAFASSAMANLASAPFETTVLHPPEAMEAVPRLRLPLSSGGSSGISSVPVSFRTSESLTQSQPLLPSALQTPHPALKLQPAGDRTVPLFTGRKPLPNESTPDISTLHLSDATGFHSTRSAAPPSARNRLKENTSFEIPESLIIRDVIFAFQGIEGKFIKYDPTKKVFVIDPQSGISKPTRQLVSRLVECGFLHNKIRKYTDSSSTDRALGLVGQSFCTALHQELTEYYRLIAVLEAQLQQDEDLSMESSGGLTLRRLLVWMFEPLHRLKTLATLVDVCQGKKGGGLASTIHSYLQHGDPAIKSLIKHILSVVAQPIFDTIIRWIFDGELEDKYHEFFVASDPTVKDDRLWHDKYSLRESMIPSFLTSDQAKRILLTGKAINFLRQVCRDQTIIRDWDVIRSVETNQVESIFTQDLDGVYQKMIDTVYKETSMHLLQVLHTKYKFMEHLKAMRRYMLLGQGDFIRHLMDLLEAEFRREDLAKPAQTLFLHNLTGILETAIRATNAQYDDVDILKRLDVRLLEVSPGDTGWDVFSLEYHVSGHIRTVFTSECMIMYLRVFNFLWRAKRMEYILSLMWKDQMANAKNFRLLPEMAHVLHQCHLICSEMMHFIQQVQYYINFEVLECSWDELLHKVKDAQDLDQIIAAHQEFLDTITNRSLLDPESTDILTQLRTIFDLIIQFQDIQNEMYTALQTELLMRQKFEETRVSRTERGEWGLSDAEENTEQLRLCEFMQTVIPKNRSKLRVLAQSYQKMVEQFLVMLTQHSDVSLQFLSFRLNFNERYQLRIKKTASVSSQQMPKKKT